MDAREPLPSVRVAILILAAGRSSRMGTNKLLARVGERTVVRQVIDSALASAGGPVIVVTGHLEAEVRAEVPAAARVVHNPDYPGGLSTSLRRGIDALPADSDGFLVCLGDMPRVTAASLDALMRAFAGSKGESVCVPTFGNQRGNPVLWPARWAPRLRTLSGDRGAKALLEEAPVHFVEVEDGGVLIDVDTPEDLARVRTQDS